MRFAGLIVSSIEWIDHVQDTKWWCWNILFGLFGAVVVGCAVNRLDFSSVDQHVGILRRDFATDAGWISMCHMCFILKQAHRELLVCTPLAFELVGEDILKWREQNLGLRKQTYSTTPSSSSLSTRNFFLADFSRSFRPLGLGKRSIYQTIISVIRKRKKVRFIILVLDVNNFLGAESFIA